MKKISLDPIVQSFSVRHEYKLHFTESMFDRGNTLLRDIIGKQGKGPVKTLFVTDQGVLDNHPELEEHIRAYCMVNEDILMFTDVVHIPGGEAAKNSESHVDKVLEAINTHHICRHSFVVVIGGGAVIDAVGYAATIAHRGVKLIRVPTTVLAQNDAAVGVKNGINHFGKKNFIGTFALPYAIINDASFLETLDRRDWISGTAEAVKVALIKDESFFHYLEEHAIAIAKRDKDPMQELIYRCARIHMEHIAYGGDPFESGSSRPLDFGHWAAHKMEQMTDYRLRHGEAVAKGIALDVTYAWQSGLISKEVWQRILQLLTSLGFQLDIPFDEAGEIDTLLKGIEEFREHLGGELTITLIDAIGSKHDVHQVDLERMKRSVGLLNEAVNRSAKK
ncbi:MAG: 3-dehydroquinate synthase [Flavobacteriaceae bacterium]|nr:3-dehydroquinate synthase [Flavobacteriaceae bacterium]